MYVKKMQMLERVLDVLDVEEVSDERIEAFREAAKLYGEWETAQKEDEPCWEH